MLDGSSSCHKYEKQHSSNSDASSGKATKTMQKTHQKSWLVGERMEQLL